MLNTLLFISGPPAGHGLHFFEAFYLIPALFQDYSSL
jgi:hypothetical protein